MRKLPLILASLFTLSGCGEMNLETSQIQIGTQDITVEIAETQPAKETGLSGIRSLEQNTGMLFVYEAADFHTIWMPDMRFSIDVLWIDADGYIVDAVRHMSPDSYPEVFSPSTPAKYILEVPAGFLEENNVNIGDIVEL